MNDVDAIEAITNATVGLVVSVLLTWLWLGFAPMQSVIITAVFFVVSTVRAYVLRRIFRRIGNG